MFKTSMELRAAKVRAEQLEIFNQNLEFKLKCANREKELEIEEAKNSIRKEMQKSLVESDLRRVEAEAKLEVYEMMDTKDDANKIREMLDKAITGLSQQAQVKILK